MKNSTLAALGGTGIVSLALIAALAQAESRDDSVQYNVASSLEIDMADAASRAAEAVDGKIIEIELDADDGDTIWEIELVNDASQVITIEVDGKSGQVLSTSKDDDTALNHAEALSLAKAIEVVTAVENGALIEAELEQKRGELIWEIESLGPENQETEYRVHAETGEILI